MQRAATLLVLACVGCGVDSGGEMDDGHADINGLDNRRDVFDVTSSTMVELAESTVVLVHNDRVMVDGDRATFATRTLAEAEGVCGDERFATQPTAGFCSGFLVAPDLVVTAAHCMDGDPAMSPTDKCKATRFVFGYRYDEESQDGKPITVSVADIHACESIEVIKSNPGEELDNEDYAIVRLATPADSKQSLGPRLRRKGAVDVAKPLAVIGNPNGLPTKVAANGRVVDTSGELTFDATLDAFSGNSGSLVATSTGKIEGILVGGSIDYEMDQGRGCNTAIRCAEVGFEGERCIGSTVLRSRVFAAAVDELADE